MSSNKMNEAPFQDRYDVFISYSRKDREIVKKIADRLYNDAKLRPFLDSKDIHAGDHFVEIFAGALQKSPSVAVFIGASGLGSWQSEELLLGLETSVRSSSKIFAVLLPGVDENDVPHFLRIREWIDFRNGPDDDDAFRKFVDSISAALTDRPPHRAPAPEYVLVELRKGVPQRPKHLLERPEQSQAINASLKENSTILLFGMPAVGKSTAAYIAAETISHAHKDGIFHISFKRKSRKQITAASKEALFLLVQSFEPSAKKEYRDLTSRARKIFADKRFVLVIDDINDVRHVSALLSAMPLGSHCIITSRQHLYPFTVQPLEVTILNLNESLVLLKTVSGYGDGDNQHILEIAKHCGGLPLALRAAGRFIEMNPQYPLEQYLQKLANEHSRLKALNISKAELNVSAVLNLSIQELGGKLAGMWRKLAIFPSDFDYSAAMAVWNIPAEDAVEFLTDLTDRSLIFFDRLSQRYRLHDLMRLLPHTRVRGRKDKLLQEETWGRYAQYFLGILKKANDDLERGEREVREILDIVNREWSNIKEAQRWSALRAGENLEAARICCEFPIMGAAVLDLWQQRPEERAEWLSNAVRSVTYCGEEGSLLEGRLLDALGVALRQWGRPGEALDHHLRTLVIAKEHDSKSLQSSALSNLGRAYWEQGKPIEALETFSKALSVASTNSACRSLEQGIVDCIGLAQRELGNPMEALRYHEHSLQMARDQHDRQSEARALDNLGLDFFSVGNFGLAQRHFQDAYQIAEKVADPYECVAMRDHIGMTLRELGKFEDAEKILLETLQAARNLGDSRMQGRTLGNLGLLAHYMGDIETAIQRHSIHLDISEKAHDVWGANAALLHIGLARLALRDVQQARISISKSLRRARQSRHAKVILESLLALGTLYAGQGNLTKTRFYAKMTLRLAQRYGDRTIEGRSLFLMARCEHQCGDADKSNLLAQQANNVLRQTGSFHWKRVDEACALGEISGDTR